MGELTIQNFAVIWLGASIGASLRFGLAVIFKHWTTSGVPAATLLANLSGALLIGIVYELTNKSSLSEQTQLFLVVGLLGSLTTFSSFSLESWRLLADGKILLPIAHSAAHLLGCLAMVWVGTVVVRVAN